MNQTYTETRLITLTSNTASQYKNGILLSHLTYDFAGLLKDDTDILHRSITIRNAQIPVSFYIINEYNNILKYSVNGVPGTIVLTRGNYNATSFFTALIGAFLANGIIATATISKITGLVTIGITGSIVLISSGSTMLKTLGFKTDVNTTGTDSVTGLYPLNLLGIKQLQIRCPTLNLMNYTSGKSQTTVLTTIPVDAVSWGMISFNDTGNTHITFSNTTLDELEIEIVDAEEQNYVDFNNVNWAMTLVITLTRKLKQKENVDLNNILTVLGKMDKPDPTADEQPLPNPVNPDVIIPTVTDEDVVDLLFLTA